MICRGKEQGMDVMKRYEFSADQRSLLEALQVPFAVYQFIDKRVVTLILSDGFCSLFGYKERSFAYHQMDHDMYHETHPDDISRIAESAFHFATEGGVYDVIYRAKVKDSPDYHMIHAKGEHVYTSSGVRLAHIWYTDEGSYVPGTEISEQSMSAIFNHTLHEASALRSSYYDHLTGLPSMTYFYELADAGRDAIRQYGGEPVMLFLDLCGMKYYNTKYGFAEGDKLLRGFSKLLISAFSNENCCRVGADHFAVYTRKEGLEEILEKLFHESAGLNDGNSLPVHVGIYVAETEKAQVGIAFDKAKIACDSLVQFYGCAFQYYKNELRDDEDHRQYILSNLDRAIENKWIQVYNQPIVRAVTGRVSDEEALARWIDPVKGFLSPAEFIPYLEDAGLIYKLDLYVLEQVLVKVRILEAAGLYIVPQSINLSRSDFDSCDIVEEIRKRVDEAGISRDKITIEITESVIGRDLDFMKGQIERFRELGFPVWMDDFGSGYSSLDVLQSIHFDLLKFDMSFMRKLDEGQSGKIVLTELMRLATALGLDTVCEGVETEDQVNFLQEIGCSKLQGYYYTKPIPLEEILERYEKGIQIGFEDPQESGYYEMIGRANLYDMTVIVNEDEKAIQNIFNTLPMGIMEARDGNVKFVRSNKSYREFLRRFFGYDLSGKNSTTAGPLKEIECVFSSAVKQCCESGSRMLFDEQMPDGSTVHIFARRIGINPVTGTMAVAIAVLSIMDANEGTTYANIARALAADYYNIYYVDIETEQFIEYKSPVGEEELVVERHGENFFAAAARDTMTRIYEEDRESFLADFSKEKVLRDIDEHGFYTRNYRLIDTGTPVNVTLKAMRMKPEGKHLIIGISIVDQ